MPGSGGLGLGLFHEESARKANQHVASHMHHKLELISKGFLIESQTLTLVLVLIIFRNVSVLMVVQTKL